MGEDARRGVVTPCVEGDAESGFFVFFFCSIVFDDEKCRSNGKRFFLRSVRSTYEDSSYVERTLRRKNRLPLDLHFSHMLSVTSTSSGSSAIVPGPTKTIFRDVRMAECRWITSSQAPKPLNSPSAPITWMTTSPEKIVAENFFSSCATA